MPIFKLTTGNLPSAIASTAIVHDDKDAFEQRTVVNGARLVYIPFKVSKEDAKLQDKELPANFSVAIESSFPALDSAPEFYLALARDYQDSILRKSVEKKIAFDPTDWDAIISDYNDESRKRVAPTLGDVRKWFNDVWVVAYRLRVEERNKETIAKKDGTPQSEANTALTINAYEKYVDMVARKECGYPLHTLKSIRGTMLRLCETGWLDLASDSILAFLMDRIETHIASVQEMVDAGV